MIEARGLTVVAGGKRLLQGVRLAVQPGEVVAVIGPNGAGKSTLLRALAGELRSKPGMVRFNGQNIGDLDARSLARRRAVVSQSVELAFPMRAAEVVMLGRLPWHGTAEAAHDGRAVAGALARAGVAHLQDRAYATLSGGERQRVQLARALAQIEGAATGADSPAALLLDEPTASLDAAHRAGLLRLLRDLAADGLAVLVILHDLNEAGFVADRVAVLRDGRLVASGPADEVLRASALGPVFGVAFREVQGGGLLPDFAG
ncbi:MAG: heme ABC transporter ATP-binding protein [Roseococcus sp.]|nr:heme ABC transporter ATP-binding protein [Roseococcus sp.]